MSFSKFRTRGNFRNRDIGSSVIDLVPSPPPEEEPVPTSTPIPLTFSSHGDTNGLFYYVGSHDDAGVASSWVNPASNGRIMTFWSTQNGSDAARCATDRSGSYDHNNIWQATGSTSEFIGWDLGRSQMQVDSYTIRTNGWGDSQWRSWKLQGSNDGGSTWTDLDVHSSDSTFSSNTWYTVTPSEAAAADPYSMIRFLITSIAGGTVVLSEVEFYGTFWEEIPPTYYWDSQWSTKDYFYYRGTHDPVTGLSRSWVNPAGNGITATNSSQKWGDITATNLTDRANTTNENNGWDSGNTNPCWAKWDLGADFSFIVDSYVLRVGGNCVLQNWTLEGSNDNTNWTVLDTRTSAPYFPETFTWNRFWCNEGVTTSYRYLRINVTASGCGAQGIIHEAFLFGEDG